MRSGASDKAPAFFGAAVNVINATAIFVKARYMKYLYSPRAKPCRAMMMWQRNRRSSV